MKKIAGALFGSVFGFFIIMMLLMLIMAQAISGASTGMTQDGNGTEINLFNDYYRTPIMTLSNEKNVVVPFSWLYGAMWYNDPDNTTVEKIERLMTYAYKCGERCELVSLEEYVDGIKPILFNRDVSKEELINSIMLFEDSDKLFFGTVPQNIVEYKGIKLSLPLDPGIYYIHSRFGLYDPWGTGEMKMHRAVDLTPHDGQEGHTLYAMMDGVVISKGYASDFGYNIVIQSELHPEFSIRFAHMRADTHQVTGNKVKAGEPVGILGNTGDSTGAHVHVEFIENGERFDPELIYNFGL